MSEFWKTVRAYRKWVGWILVGGSIVLNLNQGWITMDDVGALIELAERIIRALVPG